MWRFQTFLIIQYVIKINSALVACMNDGDWAGIKRFHVRVR